MASNGCSITPNDKEVLNQIFGQGLVDDDLNEDHNNNENNELPKTDDEREAKRLEVQAVGEAERGNSEGACEILGRAIVLAPNMASPYNNRAQVLRIMGDIDGALADIERAIELSQGRGTVACQAFTQRGLIKIRNNEKEAAKEDLQKASELGSNFAKQLLAAMNPYAALCNQMLGEVMQKLQRGES